jgi:hypothetical protein
MAAPKKLLHLDEPEVLKLMAAAKARPRFADRDHAVIAVMFYMGLKTSEAHRLDVVDIRFDKAVVYVRGSRGPRTLRLDADTAALIERWLAVRKAQEAVLKNPALFTSGEKHRLAARTMRADIKRCAKLAGLDVKRVKPLAIRHSFSVRELKKHLPPDVIEEMLGLMPDPRPSSVIRLAWELAETDAPTEQLRDAWSHSFGSSLDPKKGYDAAVGALEAVAIPTVQPKHAGATLGTVIGELRADLRDAIATNRRPRWRLRGSRAKDGGLPELLAMMDLLWTGQKRHVRGVKDVRKVTLEEAQTAVPLAEALVRWFRMGLVRKHSR